MRLRRFVPRNLGRQLLATAIGTLAAFSMLEAAMRVVVATDPLPAAELRKSERLTAPNFGTDCADKSATLGHIVRPSDVDGLVYELKPNVDTCYQHAHHRTNADGQRSRRFEPFSRPKPAGVFRVLLLGDSYAYAQAVEYESSFAAELERRLKARAAGVEVEVVNTGVPGYNTAQEAAYLAERGMSYAPDCIVILFVANDLGLPYLMLEPRDPLSLRRSYVVETLMSFARRDDGTTPEIPPGMMRLGDQGETFDGPEGRDRIPASYSHMVGRSGYRRALREIARAAGAIPVINVADYADVYGFERADHLELEKFQRELGIHYAFVPTINDRAYWVAPDDRHPNARGHALLAEQVLSYLERQKLCLPAPPR
jgi:lysophospholipase L1-like esterase